MVAVITGSGLGLERGSAFVLGSRGTLGQASLGRAGDNVYVNAATGNLVISNTDEMLIGRGLDAIISRTYNSRGQLDSNVDENDDNWRSSLVRRLYAYNSTTQSLYRTEWDGAETLYTYDAAKGVYVSTAGGGAYDTISYGAGGWRWTDGDTGAVEAYDLNNGNRLLSITDRDGNVQNFGYNPQGWLSRVTNADGGYVDLRYTGNLLTELVTYSPATAGGTPAALTRVRYGYDGQSRLSTVTVDLTPTNTADNQTYITSYSYDGVSKRVASISQTDGSRLDIAYVQVGGDYRVASYSQTVSNGVTRTTSFAYDTAALTTAITDAAGQVTTLTYDAQGQLTKIVSPPAHPGATIQTATYAYNANGDVVSIDNGDGNVTVYSHDANGNPILERDALGNTVTRTYAADNRLLTETRYRIADPDGAGGAQPSDPLTSRYVYNAQGHVRFVLSPGGRVTEYRYNTYGQLAITITYPEHAYGLGALGQTQTPSETELIAWVQGLVDKSSTERTETAYDFRGNVFSVVRYGKVLANGDGDTSPAGQAETTDTRHLYDQAGRLLFREIVGKPTSEAFVYDGMGRLITATDFNGNVTRTVFQDASSTTMVVLANGLTQTSVYNRAGERISYTESERAPNLINLAGWPTGVSGPRGRNLINNSGWPTGVNGGRGQNLVDNAGWPSASNPLPSGPAQPPGWNVTDRATETRWSLVNGPDGKQIVAIQAGQTSVNGDDPGGGGYTNDTVIDPTKAYEFTLYFRKSDLTKHSLYFGLTQHGQAYVENADDGLANVNPYFMAINPTNQQGLLSDDRWYKVVGYVLPQGSASILAGSLGGVYDTVTGAKVANSNTFRWSAGRPNNSVHARFFDYYDGTQTGYSTYFGKPEIRALDSASVIPGGNAVTPGWSGATAYTDETRWSLVDGPDGRQIVAMQAGQLDASEEGGGDYTNTFNIDGSKAYEFTYYFRKSDLSKHDIYFGTASYPTAYVENATSGVADQNPYFYYAVPSTQQQLFSSDRWYKVVAYVLPEGAANIAPGALGGVYDTVTGAKVADTTTFRWRAGRPDNGVQSRFFTYSHETQQGFSTYFAPPEVREIGGAAGVPSGPALLPGWSVEGAPQETRWKLVNGPDGKQVVAMEAGQFDPYQSGGGGYTNTVTIDGSKAYEFTLQVRKSDLTKHYLYFGLSQGNYVEYAHNGVAETNPYFFAMNTANLQSILSDDRWYKIVAYVLPQGSGPPSTTLGGLYDTVTGAKVADTNTFRWRTDRPDNSVRSRFFTYYDETQQGYSTYFLAPEVREVTTASVASTPPAATTRYQYDSLGRLRIVTDPTGVRTHALYDRLGRKTADIDADGTLTEYRYDGQNRLVSTTAYATKLTAGQMSDLTDIAGNPAEVGVESIPLTVTASDIWTWNTYDKAGRLVQTIDAAGAVTDYVYDGLSQLVSTTRRNTLLAANQVSALKVTPPTGPLSVSADATYDRTTRYFYDDMGRLIGTLDAEGYLTETVYDGAGRKIETVAYEIAATAGLRAAGTFTQIRDNVKGPNGRDNDIHNWFLYDGRGLLMASIDGQAGLTRYHYDLAGNLDQMIRGQELDLGALLAARPTLAGLPAAHSSTVLEETRYTRDSYGKVQTETRVLAGGTLETDQYFYDSVGKLVKITVAANTADARTANRRYDTRGRLTGELSGEGSAALAALGASPTPAQIDQVWAEWASLYAYDDADRLISKTTPNGSTAAGDRTVYYYDVDGRLRFSVNALGEVLEQRYDSLGRQTDIIAYAARRGNSTGLTGGLLSSTVEAMLTGLANVALDSKTSVGYHVTGTVSTSVDALGGATYYGYNAFGEELSRTGPSNGAATVQTDFAYDRRGQLLRTTRDVGGLNLTSSIAYDAFGRAVLTTDPRGAGAQASYDRNGRVATTTDGVDQITRYTHDARGNLIRSVDRNGKTTTFGYTAFNRTLTTTTPEGVTATVQKNAHGDTISITDHAGRVTSFTYDKDGRLKTQQVDPADLNLATANSYDKAGRLSYTVDARGVRTNFTYDAAGRVLDRTVDPTGLAITTRYAYDAKGQQVTVTEGLTATDQVGRVTQITYDKAGRKTAVVVDPGGLALRTEYAYDKAGRVLTQTDGAGTTAAVVTQYAYDKADRLLSKTVDPGGLNITTAYAYDNSGNVGAVTDALGRVTRYAYDAANRLTVTLDPAGVATRLVYDAEGRVIRSVVLATPMAAATHAVLPLVCTEAQLTGPIPDSANDRTTRTVFDGDGRARYAIDAMGGVIAFSYDGSGNVVKTVRHAATYAVAGDQTLATMNAWVAANASTANDRVSRAVYDAAGRATYAVDAEAYVTEFRYDAAGNVTQQIRYATTYPSIGDGATHTGVSGLIGATPPTSAAVTQFQYDNAGRLTFTTDPEGVLTHQVYDALGNVVQHYAAYGHATDGVVTARTYDKAGRLTQEVRASGQTYSVTQKWTYDGLGRVVTAENGRGVITSYAYDKASRQVTETVPLSAGVNAVTTKQYDAFGNVVKVTDPRGGVGFFYYDALNRLALQVDPEGYATKTVYGFGGEVASVTRFAKRVADPAVNAPPTTDPKDATTAFTHDRLGRLTGTTDAETKSETYTLNAFGDRITVTNKLGGVTVNVFDKRGLLTQETLPVGSVVNRFEYDARGNRTKTIEAFGLTEQRVTLYAYDKLDRLTQTTGQTVQVINAAYASTEAYTPVETIAYDRRGNVIETVKAGGARTLFYYDALDRKVAEVNAVGTLSTWVYDQTSNVTLARIYADAVALPASPGGGVPTSAGAYRETAYVYDWNNRLTSTSVAGLRVGQSDGTGYGTEIVTVTTQRVYDAMGNLIQETDARGGRILRTYDKLGRETAKVDQENYLTVYTRDAEGNVVEEIRHANRTTDPANRTVTASGEDRKTTFTYDRNGRRLTETRWSVASASVNATTGVMTTATVNATVSYSYDGLGNVTRKVEAVSTNDVNDYVDYVYDQLGRLTTTTTSTFQDHRGKDVRRRTETVYNGLGAVVSTDAFGLVKNAAGTAFETDATVEHRTTTYAYDAAGRVSTMTDATGFATAFTYDKAGNLARQSYDRFKSDGSTSADKVFVHYDALGRAVRQQTTGPSGVGGDITHLQYNAFGELTGRGITAGNVYAPVYQETFAYDAGGRMWKSNTGDGSTRLYVHDKNGQVTLTVASNGVADLGGYASIEAAINAVGLNNFTGATASAAVVVTFSLYDNRGQSNLTIERWRQLSATEVVDRLFRGKTYNAFGEVAAEIDPRAYLPNAAAANFTTYFAYNTMGRLIEKQGPVVNSTSETGAVSSGRPTETYYHDLSGRLIGTRDANGNLSRRVLLAGSGHGKDQQPIVLAEFKAGGTEATNSGIVRYGVDVFGDIRKISVEMGVNSALVTTQTFDKAGRVTSVTKPERSAGVALTDHYVYDGLGQRVRHWNSQFGASVVERTDYDAQGRIVSTIDYAGYTTGYAYEWEAGLVTTGMTVVPFGGWKKTTTHVSGRTAIEKTDYFGRAVHKTNLGGSAYESQFDLAGRLVSGGPQNGTYTYFNTGRLATSLDVEFRVRREFIYDEGPHPRPTPIGTINYTERKYSDFAYDIVGNRTSEVHATHTVKTTAYLDADPIQEVYLSRMQSATAGYDELNRLILFEDTSVSAGGPITIQYAYDQNSNVRRVLTEYKPLDTTPRTTQALWYRYDSQNRFVTTKGVQSGGTVAAGATGVELTYDMAGRRASAISATSSEAYAYTADGYLATVHIGGVLRVQETRDLLGRITQHTELTAAGVTAFARSNIVYDNNSLVLQETNQQLQSNGGTVYSTLNNAYLDSVGTYLGGVVTHSWTTGSYRTGGSGPQPTNTDTVYYYGWGDEARQGAIHYKPDSSIGTTNITTLTYDTKGRLKEVKIADGALRYIYYTTNLAGQILTRSSTAGPFERFLYVDNMRVGELGNNGAVEVDYATAINARYAAPHSGPYRNGASPTYVTDFDQSYDPINPGSEPGADSVYVVGEGDSLQSIAQALWGDASLWYLIASANGLSGQASLAAGMRLTLPAKVTNVHNNSSTFRPYDPNRAIGDIMPLVPKPPVGGKGCGVGQVLLAIIAVVVVALVLPHAISAMTHIIPGATHLSASAVSGILGGTISGSISVPAFIAGSALAGAAGSIVSQGVGLAAGIQDKFSWNAVGMAALGGAVGGGLKVAGLFQGSGFVAGALRGAASSVITQGVGVATGMQKKFDWAGVAVAGIAGGVSAWVGDALASADAKASLQAANPGGSISGDALRGAMTARADTFWGVQGMGNAAVSSLAGGMAGAGARSLVTGTSFGDNLMAALPGIIGNTIGGMIAGSLSARSSAEKPISFSGRFPSGEEGSGGPVFDSWENYSIELVSYGSDNEGATAERGFWGRQLDRAVGAIKGIGSWLGDVTGITDGHIGFNSSPVAKTGSSSATGSSNDDATIVETLIVTGNKLAREAGSAWNSYWFSPPPGGGWSRAEELDSILPSPQQIAGFSARNYRVDSYRRPMGSPPDFHADLPPKPYSFSSDMKAAGKGALNELGQTSLSMMRVGSAGNPQAAELLYGGRATPGDYVVTGLTLATLPWGGRGSAARPVVAELDGLIVGSKGSSRFLEPVAAAESAGGALLRTEVRNGYTYTLDGMGRATRIEGDLVSNAAQGRSAAAQRRAGGADRLSTDEGGHFIGRRFDGPLDDFNHFAQDMNLNRSAYKSLENSWQRALNRGSSVNVEIAPSYTGSSLRPSSLDVSYTIDGVPFQKSFVNRAGGR